METTNPLIGININLKTEVANLKEKAAADRKANEKMASRERAARRKNKELTTKLIGQIRYAFFNVMVGLFMNYEQCISKDMDDQIIFLIKKFESLNTKD